MELQINQPGLQDHHSSQILINYLKDLESEMDYGNSILYFDFPIMVSEDNTLLRTDVLLVSENYGIVIFQSPEVYERESNDSTVEDAISNLEIQYSGILSKLLKSKTLRGRPGTLKLTILPIIFLYNINSERYSKPEWPELLFIGDKGTLKSCLSRDNAMKIEEYNEARAIIEASRSLSSIKSPIRERVADPNSQSKGKIVDIIEKEIALFDNKQLKAGYNIINGPQRIRGLAGSGKTVILAMKAAQIHLLDNNADIVFTYSTKSLHGFIKKLITYFYRDFAYTDPDWNKIKIMHAWGGRSLPGVYYDICIKNGIQPKTYMEASKSFENACKEIEKLDLKQIYDYILIDEAQDFQPAFYRICQKSTKNDRIIWAYDECQNILNVKIQDLTETFGIKPTGEPNIVFDKDDQDIVLHKSYRNPKEILVAAFALGMGIYSNIVQFPENRDLWDYWGFKIEAGTYKLGDNMRIIRPIENSPLLKDNPIYSRKDNIKFKYFDKINEECSYVVENIVNDIKNNKLRPEDIVVISLDDRNTRKYFDYITSLLIEKGIDVFNLQYSSSQNVQFTSENRVTLSTIYRAKGNEAAQIYIIGVDGVFMYKDFPSERNKLFTALTRAKAWVHITGYGDNAKAFCEELQRVIDHNYELIFTMPNLGKLKLIQKDIEKKQEAFIALRRTYEAQADKLGIDVSDLIKDFSAHGVKK